MRQILAAAPLLLFTISHAQNPCSAMSVAGLRPGMTPDEVGGTMHIEAASSQNVKCGLSSQSMPLT